MTEKLGELNLTGRSLDEVATAAGEVTELLTQTARLVAATVDPGGDMSCGITLRRRAQDPLMGAFSDDRAREAGEAQYAVDRGPCLHALCTGELVVVDELASDVVWVAYRERGLAVGVGSSVSVPIVVEGVRAVMNLYAGRPHAFGKEAIEQAVAMAVDTGAAIMLAVQLVAEVDSGRVPGARYHRVRDPAGGEWCE